MTIEEEMIQSRPRQSRRSDVFSDAPDFDKMLADAMYEYDMRRQGLTARAVDLTDADREKGYIARTEFTGPGPRLIPGTDQVVYDKPPDANLLRQEILDPVYQAMQAWQGRPVRAAAQPKEEAAFIREKRGSDVVLLDPRTGEIVKEYKAERPAPKETLTPRQQSDLRSIESEVADVRRTLAKTTDLDEQMALKNRILTLERNRRRLFEPTQEQAQPQPTDAIEEALTAAPVAAPAPPPMMAIGEKGMPLAPIAPVKPGERGQAPGVAQVGMVRNGYRFKGGNPSDKVNWERIK